MLNEKHFYAFLLEVEVNLAKFKPILHYVLALHFGKGCKPQTFQDVTTKRERLAFSPNTKCNIETFSRAGFALGSRWAHVGHTFGNFLTFFHVGIKNVRKNARNNRKRE